MFLYCERVLCDGYVDLIISCCFMDHNITLYSIIIDNYKLLICDILSRHKIFLFSIFYYTYLLFYFVYVCIPYHNTKLMLGDEKTSHEGQLSSSTVWIPGKEFRLSWMVAITYPWAITSSPHHLFYIFTQHIIISPEFITVNLFFPMSFSLFFSSVYFLLVL